MTQKLKKGMLVRLKKNREVYFAMNPNSSKDLPAGSMAWVSKLRHEQPSPDCFHLLHPTREWSGWACSDDEELLEIWEPVDADV